MTLEMDDKKTLSGVRMTKAKEFLDDTKALFREGRYTGHPSTEAIMLH